MSQHPSSCTVPVSVCVTNRYMKSYSPVDNVTAQDYPNILVTAGLHDPRVGYWEPAKLVARLRELKTDNNLLLLKTEMGAGHFSVTGRCACFFVPKIWCVGPGLKLRMPA